MEYKKLTSDYDTALAELIRKNLKAYRIDIPGTVYERPSAVVHGTMNRFFLKEL